MKTSVWETIIEEIVALSPLDIDREALNIPELTPEQRKSGNYPKGHINWRGLSISIETPKGGVRRAWDDSWEVKLTAHYGFIKRSEASDGEEVDCYVGDDLDSDTVFVVDQQRLTGEFDEVKVMLGFASIEDATTTYHAGFSDGSGSKRLQCITPVRLVDFKEWLANSNTTIPFGQQTTMSKTNELNESAPFSIQLQAALAFAKEVAPSIASQLTGVRDPGDIINKAMDNAIKSGKRFTDVEKKLDMIKKLGIDSDYTTPDKDLDYDDLMSEAFNPATDREAIGKVCPECGEMWKLCDNFKDAGNVAYKFCNNCGHHKDCHRPGVLPSWWKMTRSLKESTGMLTASEMIDSVLSLFEGAEAQHPFHNSARKFGYMYSHTETSPTVGTKYVYTSSLGKVPDVRLWSFRGGNYWSIGNSISDTGNLQFGLEQRLREISEINFAKHNYSADTIIGISRNNH